MQAVRNYAEQLAAHTGAAWNQFWFAPRPATVLAVMRVAVGALAFYAVATYAPDLERWFGEGGMLPLDMVRSLYDTQWSILDYVPQRLLWPAYWASLGVLALFILGVGGRVVAVLAAAATLSFFSRAPLLTGEFESILAFLLAYLCVGRASDELSITAFFRRGQSASALPLPPSAVASNTIALRLLQIHVALAHLMMGLAQLAAPEGAWWSGEGVWLAAMRPEMSLIDLSALADHPRVVAAWSHAMTVYLLAMPALVWSRLVRPLVLACGAVVWIAFAIASGWVPFCLAMLVGLAAFIDRNPQDALVSR